MGSRSKRSRKPSGTKVGGSPPETFFTDRDLGRGLPARLRAVALRVREHEQVFPSALGGAQVPDEEWLERVGKEGWIALTHDDNITRDPVARATIERCATRVFVIRGRVPHHELAELVVDALPAIRRFLARHNAPFIARVRRTLRRGGQTGIDVYRVEGGPA